MLVIITVCHPKFTPKGYQLDLSRRGSSEGQEYEEVDGGRGGVPVSDSTYMEVGEGTPSN